MKTPLVFLLLLLVIVGCSPASASPATVTRMTVDATFASPSPDLIPYSNNVVGFSFLYPKEAAFEFLKENGYPRIDLPFQPGTSLQEKYVEVLTSEGECHFTEGAEPQSVEFNGILFKKESGSDAGAGNYYDWERYKINNGAYCVIFSFVFHSINPNNLDQPPPVFDEDIERAVIEQILSSFVWL